MQCTEQQNRKDDEEEKWKPEKRNTEEDDNRGDMKHHHPLSFLPHLSTAIRATHIFSLLSIDFVGSR
jgi:hypothetical protein